MPIPSAYTGRFAPSPSGPLHMGSLVAALASYLDARAHGGRWLVRIEDLDFDRNVSGATAAILASLQRCGMHWDGPVVWQSQRQALYQDALTELGTAVYPCACSRKEIADSRLRQGETTSNIYPGTCRGGLAPGKHARAWRLRVPDDERAVIRFDDRWCGPQQQDLRSAVGDFVLKRADGFWAYQLAVVVDDSDQGVTDVVRGADLLDSTARQIYLQRCLQLPPLRYLHVPVLNNTAGEKLSKQTGAAPFDNGSNDLLTQALLPAAAFLGLDLHARPATIERFWEVAVPAWQRLIRIQGGSAP